MKPGKNNIFKVVVIGIVVLLLSLTFFCSKKKEETGRYQVRPRETMSPEPAIAKVEFQPAQPTSYDDVKAIAVLKNTGMTYVTFRYQWFVNGEIIRGKETPLLGKKHYKKGDRVYCRVQALRGMYESRIVKSRETRIKNTPPIIKYVHPGFVKIPGRFRYTINARDHDGDSLTYRLVSPPVPGIQLNPETGEIVWDIPDIPKPKPGPIDITSARKGEGEILNREGTAPRDNREAGKHKQLPPFVKIVFEVRDSDGAAVVSSIKLDLSPGRGRPR
jgi:hypothetical protein